MKFSDFSNEKYRLNSFSVRIKYQPTVPNFLDISLSDVSTNLQNIQEAMTSLGNGNIEIGLDHDDYHGYFIVIMDTEKRIKFVFGEKAGTEVRAY